MCSDTYFIYVNKVKYGINIEIKWQYSFHVFSGTARSFNKYNSPAVYNIVWNLCYSNKSSETTVTKFCPFLNGWGVVKPYWVSRKKKSCRKLNHHAMGTETIKLLKYTLYLRNEASTKQQVNYFSNSKLVFGELQRI